MFHYVQTVRVLYRENKLHQALLVRVSFLALMTLVTLLTVLNDVLFRRLPALPSIFFIIAGFLMGYFVLSRALRFTWDEHREVIRIGRVDLLSIIIIAAYIIIRFRSEQYIANQFTGTFLVSGYTLSSFSGVMLGRFLGALKHIHLISLEENFDHNES